MSLMSMTISLSQESDNIFYSIIFYKSDYSITLIVTKVRKKVYMTNNTHTFFII